MVVHVIEELYRLLAVVDQVGTRLNAGSPDTIVNQKHIRQVVFDNQHEMRERNGTRLISRER